MSQQVGYHDITQIGAANLSAKQYYFLKITAEYTVNIATAATDGVVGIQQDDNCAAAGQGVLMRPIPAGGTSLIKMGAAAAAGSPITSDAAGKGAVATAGQRYYGRLLQASTADGDIVEMLLTTGTV